MGMQSMIFAVAAAVIGFLALTLLSVVLLRGQEVSVDSTQILRGRAALWSAVENIELDFRNIGAGVLDVSTTFPTAAVDTVTCRRAPGMDCRFSFYGRVDSSSAIPSLVEYLWRQGSDEIIDTDLSGDADRLVSTPTYVLRRLVDGEFRFAVDGVRAFRLLMLDADGVRTPAMDDIRQISVNLSILVPTTQTDEQLEEVTWASVFRPANLSRE